MFLIRTTALALPERLAAATQALVDRALAGDEDAVAEALAAVEAFGLVLLAAGVPTVGPEQLAAHGLLRLPALAARVEPPRSRLRGRNPWVTAAARRGRLWVAGAGSPGAGPFDLVRRGRPGPPVPEAPLPEGLGGRPGALGLAPAAAAAPRKPTSEGTLLRLLRGELDGFRAAEVAREQVRTDAGRQELRWLVGWLSGGLSGRLEARPSEPGAARRADTAAPPLLRLAAEGSAMLRDPEEGQPVGTAGAGRGKHRLVVEAVRFPDGVLALYASQPVSLALGAAHGGTAPGRGARRRVGASAGGLDAAGGRAGGTGGGGTGGGGTGGGPGVEGAAAAGASPGRSRGGPRVRAQAPGYLEVEGWSPDAPLLLRAGEVQLALKPPKA